jgi:hypothetical protein
MNRVDKHFNQLSKTEMELGGIPSSPDVIMVHGSAIETYIEKYIGYDEEGNIKMMPFNRTLESWAKYDISKRTLYDATVSSGFAVMANQKGRYLPQKKANEISITFARYDNTGVKSKLIHEDKLY